MKKHGALVTCHLILMALTLLFSLFGAIFAFVNFGIDANKLSSSDKTSLLLFGFLGVYDVIGIGAGIGYLLRGYGKNAATYYKMLLVLIFFAKVLGGILAVTSGLNSIIWLLIILLITVAIKAAVLLVLAGWKDLGKNKTIVLFWILFALELFLPFLCIALPQAAIYIIVLSVNNLVIAGAIGLSIRAKYADKQARGRNV